MVEGYTDVIAMHQCGLENVVANSGTALSEQQIRLLHRFTSNITLLYDGDEAGIKASIRGIDMLLAEGMNIKVLLLPDGDDPDSFPENTMPRNSENTLMITKRTLSVSRPTFTKDAQRDPIKRAGLISDMARSIGLIPDKVIRYTCLTECATLLNVNEQIILDEIKSICFNGMITIWNKSRKKKTHPPLSALCLLPMHLSCRQHTSCRYAPIEVDDDVPPPFPPAEAEAGYQSYIPQEGREKYVFM